MMAMDAMVRDVVTVKPDDTVAAAIKLLDEQNVGALPVVDETGGAVGIVNETDLVHRVENETEKHRPWWLEAITPAATLAGEFAKAHGRAAHEAMSSKVVSAGEETPLAEVANLLERHRIKRVPILRDGKLVGIVSRSSLIQALASSDALAGGDVPTDRTIRLELLGRLGAQSWTDFGSRNVIVKDGTVHLWGLVGAPAEREALLALAQEILGVKRVADETIPAY